MTFVILSLFFGSFDKVYNIKEGNDTDFEDLTYLLKEDVEDAYVIKMFSF